MSTYIARVPCVGKEGWDYGVYVAASVEELFWHIDEWTDPFGAQFRKLKSGFWICRDFIENGIELDRNESFIVSVSEHEDCKFVGEETEEVAVFEWFAFASKPNGKVVAVSPHNSKAVA